MKIYDHIVEQVTRRHTFKVEVNSKEYELTVDSVNGKVIGTIKNAIKTHQLKYFDETSSVSQEKVLKAIKELISQQQF